MGPCLRRRGFLRLVSQARLRFGGLAYTKEAASDENRRREWDFKALSILERLFEASLAAENEILECCLYKKCGGRDLDLRVLPI